MDWSGTVEIQGWLAVLGGMALGALLYAAGFAEGRRVPAAKPTVLPFPKGGDLE